MSHFCGLVILTPAYMENHSLEDSLEKYDEKLEVPEYSRGEVCDYDKINFIEYYLEKDGVKIQDTEEALYKLLLKEKNVKRWCEKTDGTRDRYLRNIRIDNKDRYVELFKELNPKEFDMFAELYEKYGDDWNGEKYRINPDTGKWEEYSTYNPLSKWDWYDENGRWSNSIKTKSDEYVNQCLLGEIDWTDFKPEDYEEEEKKDFWGKKYKPLKEDVRWHFTESNPPFNVVIDGEWIEKGEMGWWGITTNEMSNEDWSKKFFELIKDLPMNSQCYNIDFHI